MLPACVSLRVERVPADALARPVFAARANGLALDGFRLAQRIADVPQPEERFDPDERAALAQTLESALSLCEPPVAVLDSARSLARPGTACVVTGQQPGFLASPLLSLYKGLHAVRLARSLAQAWERPVVPIFWNHGDDHDVAEVHHAHLVNEHLDLQRVALAGFSSGRQPISTLALDAERQRLGPLRELLVQSLQRHRHAGEALELLMPRQGETLVRAFTRALLELLGPLGLVPLEPDWIRDDLSRALAHVVGCDAPTRLAEGTAAVRAAGLEPTIDPEGAALVYRVDEGGRSALRAGGDGYRYDGEPGSRRASELAAEIVGDPAAWSAGALLRPLAQDLALPIAAYVGGWAEVGYQAQLGPLRRAAGAPFTPLVARVSCTLVEPEVRTSLAKLGTDVESVLRARGEFAAEELPEPPVIEALRTDAERASQLLLSHRDALAELDPGLASHLARGASQVRGLVDKLREKAERVHRNLAGKGRRHERRCASWLAPRGEPQERVLGPLPFLARHGTGWVDALFDQLAPFEDRHLLVHFEQTT